LYLICGFTTASRTALGLTQPPIQWVPGALSLGVKRPVREADHSPLSSAEVKNAWSHTSTPQYVFMAWCSVKAQGQLYLFTFFYFLHGDTKALQLHDWTLQNLLLPIHRFVSYFNYVDPAAEVVKYRMGWEDDYYW
jgi:hypothetical protein